MKTLEALKAENAAAEEELAKANLALVKETEDEAAEDETEELEDAEEQNQESEDSEDEESAESGESEAEPWMQADDQESEGEETVPLGSHISMRSKLKGKIGERDEELAKLRAEIDALKAGKPAEPAQSKPMPTMDSVDHDEARYQQEVTQWIREQVQGQVAIATQSASQTQGQAREQEQVEEAVNSHYERAAKLTKESGIAPEVYQASDLKVRQLIDGAYPKMGDAITDRLIGRLGEGSEKVMYYLGRNQAAQEKLRLKLMEDPTGVSAAIYLGELKSGIAKPHKQTSRARPPAKRPKGDEGGKAGESAMLKKYRAAHKSGDIQSAFNLKQQAKKSGADTSKW